MYQNLSKFYHIDKKRCQKMFSVSIVVVSDWFIHVTSFLRTSHELYRLPDGNHMKIFIHTS